MPASLDDILTAQKNGVVNLSNIAQASARQQGTATSQTVTSSTVVLSGKGYLSRFSVVVAGSTTGTINDASASVLPAATNALCTIPTVVGIYEAGLVFSNGLTIVPGTGQSVNITYYVG